MLLNQCIMVALIERLIDFAIADCRFKTEKAPT